VNMILCSLLLLVQLLCTHYFFKVTVVPVSDPLNIAGDGSLAVTVTAKIRSDQCAAVIIDQCTKTTRVGTFVDLELHTLEKH